MDKVIFGAAAICLFLLTSYVYAKNNDNTGITIDSPLTGHWVVDPREAGESLPPVGRSLFDFVFSKTTNGETVYDIPFPYSRLIDKLDKLVQADSILISSVKQVLIPLGRSLARNIARPDFFRYPRVVSVVDTEPKFHKINPGIMLKDRLYIGYGEATEILEIISYNEEAGRFEFQIVTDYRPGGKPRVFYANREVCGACHQNGALIFSRQQWDETNSNPRIAALLEEHQASFYGVPVDRGVDIPFAIDAATDRANLFAFYQLLWQQGCEAGATHSINPPECRKTLLTYTLQYLLSNRSVFDNQSDYYRKEFIPRLKANWKTHWPDGLLIPDPDIPNRDPLLIKTNTTTVDQVVSTKFSDKAASTLNTMLSKNDVPDKFEPLNFRPPMEIWSTDMKEIDQKLISGLASFIPSTDIQRIDRQLTKTKKVPLLDHDLSCNTDETRLNKNQRRIRFDCESSTDNTSLKGRFVFESKEWLSGKISKLVINGQSQFDLILKPVKLTSTRKNSLALLKIYSSSDFAKQTNLLAARFPDGNSIDHLKLSWIPENPESKTKASLVIRQDFKLIKTAISELLQSTAKGQSDVLSNKPFRRASIMKLLQEKLGIAARDWCCVDSSKLPVARLQDPDNEVVIVAQSANSEIAPFYHYCSTCHRTSNPQPPNFLQGNENQVAKNISQCAERIFFRLSMWQQNSKGRAKSPMPPATALHKLGFSQRHWSSSDELLSLKHAVSKLINEKTGKNPDLQHYIKTGFNNLPECIPRS